MFALFASKEKRRKTGFCFWAHEVMISHISKTKEKYFSDVLEDLKATAQTPKYTHIS